LPKKRIDEKWTRIKLPKYHKASSENEETFSLLDEQHLLPSKVELFLSLIFLYIFIKYGTLFLFGRQATAGYNG
jgi:hypothetical protein